MSSTAPGVSRPSGSKAISSATLGLSDFADLSAANESGVTASHALVSVAAAMDIFDVVGDLMDLRCAGSGMNPTSPLDSDTAGGTELLASVTATTTAGDVYPTQPSLANPGPVTCLFTYPDQPMVIAAYQDVQI
ncbi:hypothetical protein D915_001130 [Fasciola hepatica]|uniref:Uncharacterized protein n=1 Tax=Fasciola hepatica TaxID=6192 RepID=A0A4E0RJZ2_FASHE|nr:hypothetical protein D915_001130 [Fasciola hepatica]